MFRDFITCINMLPASEPAQKQFLSAFFTKFARLSNPKRHVLIVGAGLGGPRLIHTHSIHTHAAMFQSQSSSEPPQMRHFFRDLWTRIRSKCSLARMGCNTSFVRYDAPYALLEHFTDGPTALWTPLSTLIHRHAWIRDLVNHLTPLQLPARVTVYGPGKEGSRKMPVIKPLSDKEIELGACA